MFFIIKSKLIDVEAYDDDYKNKFLFHLFVETIQCALYSNVQIIYRIFTPKNTESLLTIYVLDVQREDLTNLLKYNNPIFEDNHQNSRSLTHRRV